MRELIKRNIAGKKVLLFFVITNVIYAIMLLITIPKLMSFSKGMNLLDMMPTGYNEDYVKLFLNELGAGGRSIYLYNQLPVDMIYPLFFGISYCLLLAYFLNKLNRLDGILFYFSLFPIIAALFDYLENMGIITLLLNYPDFSKTLVVTTNTFTILKSTFTTLYFIVLFLTIIYLGVVSYKKRKKIV